MDELNEPLIDMKDKVCLVTGATSGIGKEAAFALAGMNATVVLVGLNREEGARPILYLGCSPKVSGITGRYFVKEKMAVSQAPYDRESARLLWEVSAAMAGIAH